MLPRVPDRRTRVSRLGVVAALLGGLLLAILPVTTVGATNFAVTVTTTVDSNYACATTGMGICSLRDAIRFANTKTAADMTTITLPANIAPYTLTQTGPGEDNAVTGDLDITANVTINGAGASTTVIDGNQSDRVFQVFAGFTVSFNNLTIQNGAATSAGGGLFVAASAIVTLTGCVVTNNSATSGVGWGAASTTSKAP